mgnify:FL=1|jgi:PBP1b-binding outer membrane lipoprotein LpoB|tara:strand:+ start:434 stop:634 length:201 start_codon:yes stop_codon:yes gene_type:complete
MKLLALITASIILLTGCSVPKNPEIVFGKKCLVEGDRITYSYMWIQDKNLDTKPSVEACEQLPTKE